MRIQGTVLYILLLHILANKADAIDPDGEALLNFKDSIIGSDGVFLHWTAQSADACSWEGVKCNPQTNRVTDVILSYHKLSGSISQHISKLEHLKLLALDNNNLYGPIPSELSNCTELRSLYLQGNYISGSIPSELGNLSELRYLDVSSNSLGGHLPSSLGSLTKLSVFNVSANFLLGPIPPEGILVKFQRSSFSGNRGLCGKPIDVACRRGGNGSDSSARPRARGNSGRLLISASATIGALLLVALMCFWGCFLYKRLSKGGHGGRGPLGIDLAGGASIVMFHGDLPYSSKDIVRKLETLKEDDVIGVGGFGTVYRLSMDDGSVFALKRIVKFKDSFFDRELEILGSIKHRYLVNLRGYCNSPTSKLLLYDFLPGGSLDEVLHERSGALDWDARMNIAMGAAKGLAYLHHDCSPRIIHRDIKSSNILLDGNLDTRVSDFGLAKLLEDDKSHITTIVAGTFGYLAPEYMQSGRATEKTDVYSFGVLLLELLSRKRPTDASFIEKGLNIVGWMNFLVTENRHREIVDGSCGGAEQQGLDTLLSLAIQCVSASPEDRPTMNQVAQVLESQVMTPCPSDFYDSNSD